MRKSEFVGGNNVYVFLVVFAIIIALIIFLCVTGKNERFGVKYTRIPQNTGGIINAQSGQARDVPCDPASQSPDCWPQYGNFSILNDLKDLSPLENGEILAGQCKSGIHTTGETPQYDTTIGDEASCIIENGLWEKYLGCYYLNSSITKPGLCSDGTNVSTTQCALDTDCEQNQFCAIGPPGTHRCFVVDPSGQVAGGERPNNTGACLKCSDGNMPMIVSIGGQNDSGSLLSEAECTALDGRACGGRVNPYSIASGAAAPNAPWTNYCYICPKKDAFKRSSLQYQFKSKDKALAALAAIPGEIACAGKNCGAGTCITSGSNIGTCQCNSGYVTSPSTQPPGLCVLKSDAQANENY